MNVLTLTEMAAALGLKSTPPLRRLCERGEIRAVLKGKTWLVTPAEVERYRRDRLGRRGIRGPDKMPRGERRQSDAA